MTGKQVKALRKRFGDTQEQFARRVNVSPRTVSLWETGKSRPSRLAIAALERI